jgi:hypothetical protein
MLAYCISILTCIFVYLQEISEKPQSASCLRTFYFGIRAESLYMEFEHLPPDLVPAFLIGAFDGPLRAFNIVVLQVLPEHFQMAVRTVFRNIMTSGL